MSVTVTSGQYKFGRRVKPRASAMGEDGNHMPTIMIATVVSRIGQLARLCKNGMR